MKGEILPNETVKKIEPAFEDERGAIANVLEEPISHVAVITSKKGSVRGNHYHPEQVQYEYLISGSYESVSKDLRKKDSKEEKMTIEAGDLVITPPMVAHAMKFTEDSIMLNLTTGKRDSHNLPEHTKKYKLI
jgi:dTDP-4-dehydrorhamnose 3,5-epimerase-like enzyme